MSRVLPVLFNTEMVTAILEDRKTATRRLIKPQPTEEMKYKLGYCVMGGPKKDIGKFGFGTREWGGRILCARPPARIGDILYVRETWAFMNCINCAGDYRRPENEPPCYDTQAVEYDDGYSISDGCFIYRAGCRTPERITWCPSIHMPKEAARIWLKVTDVKPERLQDITEEQANREGIIRLYNNLPDAEYAAWIKKTEYFPKRKEEWGYKNYLWHGNFGTCGTGNKMSDAWGYQYSSYNSAIDSFSSLWNTTVPLKEWDIYGWEANPWVWAINFERIEKPEE